MKKVLTVGSATQDIFIDYKNPQAAELEDFSSNRCSYLLVAEGRKIEVQELYYATGGGSTNSAVSFKKLGLDVTSFFHTGADPEADYILRELKNAGINCDLVQKISNHKTGRSFILPSPTGNQPILAYRGVNAFLSPNDLPLQYINNIDLLYITSLSGKSSECLLPLAQHAHKYNIPVITNPGSSQLAVGIEKLRAALPFISVLLLNTTEACQLMYTMIQHEKNLYTHQNHDTSENPKKPDLLKKPLIFKGLAFNLADFFKLVHDHGPEMVVITNGAEGVYLSDSKTIYFHATVPTKVMSTVGAGDAFGSCFAASIVHNKSIEEALISGILNASSVIGKLGAKEGLLTQQEIDQLRKKTEIKEIYSQAF